MAETSELTDAELERAKKVMTKLARREKFNSDELNRILEEIEKALRDQPRLTDEELNRRAGH